MALRRKSAFKEGGAFDKTGPMGTGKSNFRKTNEYKNFFYFFGVTLTEQGKNHVGQCPFRLCGKEGHFYVNISTGQWDCKRCGENGNHITFMRKFIDDRVKGMKEPDYKWLCSQRQGIDQDVFKNCSVVRFGPHDALLPTFNKEGEIVSVYKWSRNYDAAQKEYTYKMIAAPTTNQHLLGMEAVNVNKSYVSHKSELKKILMIAEGHWDFYAAKTLIRRLKLQDSYSVVGSPGANVFPEPYALMLDGREVWIIGDNDAAGRGFSQKISNLCSDIGVVPTNLYYVKWPISKADGYDLRDLCIELAPQRAMNDLIKYRTKVILEKTPSSPENFDPTIKPVKCESLDELVDSLGSKLVMNDIFTTTFVSMLSTCISTKMGGNPVWQYVVGPPSSGKTTLAECISAAQPYVRVASKFTGIYSGFRSPKDAGLVPLLDGKTFIVKDFTTVLSATEQERARILGDLRDIYDGSGSSINRNHVKREYTNVNFSMLACVTDAIRMYNVSSLGERFLMCEINGDWSDDGQHFYVDSGSSVIDRAIDNAMDMLTESKATSTGHLNKQRCMTWGFIEYMFKKMDRDKTQLQEIGESLRGSDFKSLIRDYASWISFARAKVDRDRSNEVIYQPKAEQNPRIATQLTKLTAAACLVRNISEPDEFVHRMIRKLALDTAFGPKLELMIALVRFGFNPRNPKIQDGMPLAELTNRSSFGPTSVQKILDDMQELKIVSTTTPVSYGRGRPSRYYKLSDDLYEGGLRMFRSIADESRETKPAKRPVKRISIQDID